MAVWAKVVVVCFFMFNDLLIRCKVPSYNSVNG